MNRTIRINMMVPVKWSILGIFMLTSVISAGGRSALNVGQVVDNAHVIFGNPEGKYIVRLRHQE